MAYNTVKALTAYESPDTRIISVDMQNMVCTSDPYENSRMVEEDLGDGGFI